MFPQASFAALCCCVLWSWWLSANISAIGGGMTGSTSSDGLAEDGAVLVPKPDYPPWTVG